MQQPDHLASVNNCPTNSHTMAQQSNNNFNNGSSASMQGLSANTNQLTLSNKSNFNKGGLIQNYIDVGSVHEIEFSLVTNSVYNTLSFSHAV